MHWLDDFKVDVSRYVEHSGKPLKAVLQQPGLWALLQYRVAHAYGHHSVARPALAAWRLATEMTAGISIGSHARIDPGCYIGHYGGIIINDGAVIGRGAVLSQGVTIGAHREGAPRIGRDVYIGPHAVVVGDITIGDGAMIGANAVVSHDVPPRARVRPAPVVVTTPADE